jgi:hypothetical protein
MLEGFELNCALQAIAYLTKFTNFQLLVNYQRICLATLYGCHTARSHLRLYAGCHLKLDFKLLLY